LANRFATKAIAYRAGVVQQQIQASITQLQARIAALGPAARNSAEAQAMASSLVQLQAVRGTREPTMSISQTAELPTSRSGVSRTLLLLIALAAGLVIGCIAAIALDAFGRPVQDPEEIRSIYPLPVLAGIPDVAGSLRPRRDTPPWALPPFAFEQFRMLKVQLSLFTDEPVIMVTSAGAGDGKTTVAAALAAAFAEAGRKVILMDLDLRKPSLASLLGVRDVPGGPGANGKDEFGSVPVDRLPGVRVLPPPLADLSDLDSLVARLPSMLDQIRAGSGVVIIDTSPVGEVSEALQLARICDQVLFVARPRHTDRRRLRLARDLLNRAGAKVVGLVLVGKGVGTPRQSQAYGYAYSLPQAQHEAVPNRASTRSSVFVEADPGGRSHSD
jgi:Mrp family chromosome partitioning ATPase